jgi:NADH-quinone oxidoreductase subunit H
MTQLDWIILLTKVVVIVGLMFNLVPIMVWVERRGSALIQNRLGPNRLGPLGLFQGIADGVKSVFKEDRAPGHVAKFYWMLAPVICMIPAFMSFAVIPFANDLQIGDQHIRFQIANLDVGILYMLSITSLGVYGIIMGAWSSNNKYALLGGLRSSAQMVSYELSMGLAIVASLMVYSTVNLSEIATLQGQKLLELGPITIPRWGIFTQPLGFLILLTTAFAETNRLPFDLPEGESEIVAGYHLEFSTMKFGMFMMAEYMNMATASLLISTMYFGGWQMLPGFHALHQALGLTGTPHEIARVALEFTSLLAKLGFFLWFFVWVRWTIPRFRYDQLMFFGWKVLLPLALLNIFITGGLIYLGVI